MHNRKKIALAVLQSLQDLYPETAPHLHYRTPWELLVATVLSAQCTDARVNMVTPPLFARLPDVKAFAEVDLVELETLIHSTGFYKNKAKHLQASARKIIDCYNGEVPQSMRELLQLDGVARKTANVVLWNAFGKNEGIAVDTHVARISVRLGLADKGSPASIEQNLCAVFPREEWGNVNHRMISFGRAICMARKPACGVCRMSVFCPKIGVISD